MNVTLIGFNLPTGKFKRLDSNDNANTNGSSLYLDTGSIYLSGNIVFSDTGSMTLGPSGRINLNNGSLLNVGTTNLKFTQLADTPNNILGGRFLRADDNGLGTSWALVKLNELENVSFDPGALNDGDILQYNASSNEWHAVPLPRVKRLEQLDDVEFSTSPALNQLLVYDGASNWINVNPDHFSHNAWSDLQGGDSNAHEFYHITQVQHNLLVSGNQDASSLHNHNSLYYRKSESDSRYIIAANFSLSLYDLNNVNIDESNLQGNEALLYNGTDWTAGQVSRVFIFNDLNDVTITTPINPKSLMAWNGVNQWCNYKTQDFKHNEWGSLQGGTADEYYHLTQAQHNLLTAGNQDASSLHNHDTQYYSKAQADSRFVLTTDFHMNLGQLDDVNIQNNLVIDHILVYDGAGHWHNSHQNVLKHNLFSQIQGGNGVDEFYHLTESQYDTLVNGQDASSLHNHDAQYYTKSQVDGNYVKTDGTSQMLGDLNMGHHNVRNIYELVFSNTNKISAISFGQDGLIKPHEIPIVPQNSIVSTNVQDAIYELGSNKATKIAAGNFQVEDILIATTNGDIKSANKQFNDTATGVQYIWTSQKIQDELDKKADHNYATLYDEYLPAEDIVKGEILCLTYDSTNDVVKVKKALAIDNTTKDYTVIGVALNNVLVSSGDKVKVCSLGKIDTTMFNFIMPNDLNSPVYLSDTTPGRISLTTPTQPNSVECRIGYVAGPSTVMVNIDRPVIL